MTTESIEDVGAQMPPEMCPEVGTLKFQSSLPDLLHQYLLTAGASFLQFRRQMCQTLSQPRPFEVRRRPRVFSGLSRPPRWGACSVAAVKDDLGLVSLQRLCGRKNLPARNGLIMDDESLAMSVRRTMSHYGCSV